MNSFIGWIGGKKLLRNDIVTRFPQHIDRYIEVCGGAGWVLFHKDRHAEMEVYNDYNSDLVNLFRCIKFHASEVQKELSYILNSREVFEDYLAQNNTRGLTDIQRAARFFVIVKISYGSTIKTYGCCKKDMNAMIDYLDKVQNRLKNVIIENKSYDDVIKVYDRPGSLFYIDPPYYRTEKYYAAEFREEDHVKLRDILSSIKGKFLLSYNDCEYIRELYKDFKIEEVSRNNSLVSRYEDKDKNYCELIIRNY
jgi:DNA adenine methylase